MLPCVTAKAADMITKEYTIIFDCGSSVDEPPSSVTESVVCPSRGWRSYIMSRPLAAAAQCVALEVAGWEINAM